MAKNKDKKAKGQNVKGTTDMQNTAEGAKQNKQKGETTSNQGGGAKYFD